MSGRPNILFVFTDQQTRNAMSAVGNPWVRTPHMDSLARSGPCSPAGTPSSVGATPIAAGRMARANEGRVHASAIGTGGLTL